MNALQQLQSEWDAEAARDIFAPESHLPAAPSRTELWLALPGLFAGIAAVTLFAAVLS